MATELKELAKILERKRKEGQSIVVCTGSFDLFHANHVEFLKNAKKHGDVLVVAVKNDKCVRLKGKDRPIVCEEDRAKIVESIKGVDYVILADYDPSIVPEVEYDNENQLEWLIMFNDVFKELKPNIFYHEINPKLETVRVRAFEKYDIKGIAAKRLEGISTSRLIAKIRKDK